MKTLNLKVLNALSLFILVVCLIGCKKNKEPLLTTTAITSTTASTATSGGNVTSDGGETILSRGVCWSTNNTPTIADNKTLDGAGAGSFVSVITGLTPKTTYFVRAYATNASGTGYGMAMSFTTLPIAIGGSYAGGKVAYLLISSDPGYDANVQHGLIAAPSDQSTSAAWGCDGTSITGADGAVIGSGSQNTIDIVAVCTTAGIAAKLCYDLVLDGYSDWYLPSKDELNKLYINKVAIGGFVNGIYWSSTEYSNNLAYTQHSYTGSAMLTSKYNTYSVRAIRSF